MWGEKRKRGLRVKKAQRKGQGRQETVKNDRNKMATPMAMPRGLKKKKKKKPQVNRQGAKRQGGSKNRGGGNKSKEYPRKRARLASSLGAMEYKREGGSPVCRDVLGGPGRGVRKVHRESVKEAQTEGPWFLGPKIGGNSKNAGKNNMKERFLLKENK